MLNPEKKIMHLRALLTKKLPEKKLTSKTVTTDYLLRILSYCNIHYAEKKKDPLMVLTKIYLRKKK